MPFQVSVRPLFIQGPRRPQGRTVVAELSIGCTCDDHYASLAGWPGVVFLGVEISAQGLRLSFSARIAENGLLPEEARVYL